MILFLAAQLIIRNVSWAPNRDIKNG